MTVLAPTSDQAVGSWTTTPLWSKADEDSTLRTTGDGVEITSDAVGNNTNTSNADLKLASGSDPGVDTNHVLRVRWRRSGTQSLQAHAELWEGVPGTGTMRAEIISATDVGGTEVEASLKLTTTEAGAITDYTNLYVRLWGRGTGGGAARSLVVELVDLYIPNAVGSFTVQTLRSATNTAGTSHVVSLPDGSNTTGRTVVAGITFDVPATVTWPTGWTVTDASTTGCHLSIGRRIIDGTEGFTGTNDTITVTTTASMTSTHETHLITGAHGSTVPEVATATGLSTTPDPPSLDPTGWATETTLWMAACGTRFNEAVTAAPANYSGLFLSDSTNGDNGTLAFAFRSLNAGSEDPGTFTQASSLAWVAATVAVRPTAAGGATQTLTGTLTSSATVVKAAAATKTGTVTPTGAAAKAVTKPGLAGTITSAGALAKQAQKPLTGTITSTGIVASVKVVLQTLAGTITSTGALLKQAAKTLTGTTTPTGMVIKAAAASKTGTVAPTGAITKAVQHPVAGTITSIGLVSSVKVVLQTLAGTLTSAGNLLRQAQKTTGGTVVSTGIQTRAAARTLAGSVSPAGGLAKSATRLLVGIIASAGSAISSLAGADENPVTVTVRDHGHTATVEDTGHTVTVRDYGHTATAREMH